MKIDKFKNPTIQIMLLLLILIIVSLPYLINSYKYLSKKRSMYLSDKRAIEIKSEYLDQQKLYKQTQEKLINSYGIRTLEYDDYYNCSQISCTPDISTFKINGDINKYQSLKRDIDLSIQGEKIALSKKFQKNEYNCSNLDQLYKDLEQSKIERENYSGKGLYSKFDPSKYRAVSLDDNCKKLMTLDESYKSFQEDLPKITSLILEKATSDNKSIQTLTRGLKFSLCLMDLLSSSSLNLKEICKN